MRNWLAAVFAMGFSATAAAQDNPCNPCAGANPCMGNPCATGGEMGGDMGTTDMGGGEEATADAGHAGMHAGVMVGGSKILGDAADFFGFGFGGGLRAGYEIEMGAIGIDPGVVFMFNHYGAKDPNPEAMNVIIFDPGARIYYHAGSISPFFNLQFGLASAKSIGDRQNKANVAFGAGADYWVSSTFGVGLYFDYMIIMTDPSTKIVNFGLDTVFHF